ncbi:phosphoribosyltransferase family protein [Wenyingzhuangia marina]|uniref:Pyrimidine operon attenuation protein / uracil phosphoribosyltransferase n=1 Tax=Wenyingzhuangia marina TaxID=1195760 RepID=A0A1M5W2F7_9FLAO|nr:phosphoribosyltransferase family protein [Wenyingzhuangia marina]GGF76388.1 phosphoribosyltransferase [Wenyingzhuangia marina]SHH81682.1 pyrimidine operon attenuation protein / uracil phosphoribosyltransferase [Wenyingzhuangia marina]
MNKSIILNHQEITQKTRRIAFQILESHCDVDEIILAGINGNGFIFAQHIKNHLTQISDLNITLCEVILDKKNPLNTIETSISKENYTNKHIVLIDDVLNSGKTLIYGVKHFLNVSLASFKTAVLVNRNHKEYPVKADFKGISLSTSLQETIEVDFSNEEESVAYLC